MRQDFKENSIIILPTCLRNEKADSEWEREKENGRKLQSLVAKEKLHYGYECLGPTVIKAAGILFRRQESAEAVRKNDDSLLEAKASRLSCFYHR
jgi:hypothetical protein